MSEFRLETLTMPAASMGADSPWPALQPHLDFRQIRDPAFDAKTKRDG